MEPRIAFLDNQHFIPGVTCHLNKDKYGAMYLSSGISTLKADEQRSRSIDGIPIIAHYKYLGVFLLKNLQPTAHLQYH
jgi:hypothetical protein